MKLRLYCWRDAKTADADSDADKAKTAPDTRPGATSGSRRLAQAEGYTCAEESVRAPGSQEGKQSDSLQRPRPVSVAA